MKECILKTATVDLYNAEELDCFVRNHPNGHFFQTSSWGRVKSDWKWFGVICTRGSAITGTVAVLVRRIAETKYHMMYVPRGPVCDFGDSATFSALINAVVDEGKKHNVYKLITDKDIPCGNTEYRNLMISNGFRFCKRRFGFEDFQCRFVFRLNIENKTADGIFEAFHPKHRYNIRLAARKGVEIRLCGADKADEFSAIMKATGERDGFSVKNGRYYAAILEAFGDDARLYLAYYGGVPIAGSLAVRCGGKVWYFYGGSLNIHRNLMPNYLLQWEMIKWAVESGCEIYDFRGVSGKTDETDPLYGLYRFKKGFNGDLIEFAGQAELVIDPVADAIITLSQKIIKKFKSRRF